jgi:hypothetical protein
MRIFAVRIGYAAPESVRQLVTRHGYINKFAEVRCRSCVTVSYTLYAPFIESDDVWRYVAWCEREIERHCGDHPDFFETAELRNADLAAA